MATPGIILTTSYLSPIAYFRALLGGETIYLEKHETYPKQTYRNRCHIYSANGVLPLSIPVKKPMGNRTKICDILIDNSVKWNKEHWRAIVSAYSSSAYFEYLMDYFTPFYENSWNYLWDFNLELLHVLLDILEVEVSIKETDEFILHYPDGYSDLRDISNPKSKIDSETFPPYFQVFELKYGFIPNLSILDLLCSRGMDAKLYLLP